MMTTRITDQKGRMNSSRLVLKKLFVLKSDEELETNIME
jgi:hypothetical protein